MARSSFWSLSFAVCAALATLTLVGCGSSGPATQDVTGKVTIDGQAAPKGCTINFHPLDTGNQMASGEVGDDGSYTLFTGVSGTPGAMVGKYKVVVLPPVEDAASGESEPGYMSAKDGEGGPPPINQESDVVPKAYTDVSTTPEQVEVTSGSKTINIQIKSGESWDSDPGAAKDAE